MQEQEDIFFESMPDFGQVFAARTPVPEPATPPRRTYKSLFEELTDKVFPERFMEPYDAEKVSLAIQLYQEVLLAKNDEDALNDLRRKAYNVLGICFDGTKLYNRLMHYFNPRLYLSPFNPDDLNVANQYYPAIEKNKNNHVALEEMLPKLQWFIDKKDAEAWQKAAVLEQEQDEMAYVDDNTWIEDVRNLMGEEYYRQYIEDEYGNQQ